MIHWPAKEPLEELDYLFQFGDVLGAGETIVTKAVTVSGVTLDDDDIVGEDVQVWLSGGTAATVATITCQITTSSSPSRTFVETALLPIGGGAIDVARAKAHLRVDFDSEDMLIAAYLSAALGVVEMRTGRILSPRAMVQRIDGFVDRSGSEVIKLYHDPVVSVESIDYIDVDGAEQSLADGEFRTVAGEPYMLLPLLAESWPSASPDPGAVSVQYIAGYTAGALPAELEAAVLLMVGHLFANREAASVGVSVMELPLGVEMLCAPFRRVLIG